MQFLVDVMFGKLATYLRICGHDTAYALERDATADDAVIAWARDEDRTVVTRDEALAAAASEPDAILLAARDIEAQLAELAAAGVDLSLPAEPTRCSRCNGVLKRLPPETPRPEYVPEDHEGPIWRCPDCAQCYWRGSHWDDVSKTLARLQ